MRIHQENSLTERHKKRAAIECKPWGIVAPVNTGASLEAWVGAGATSTDFSQAGKVLQRAQGK